MLVIFATPTVCVALGSAGRCTPQYCVVLLMSSQGSKQLAELLQGVWHLESMYLGSVETDPESAEHPFGNVAPGNEIQGEIRYDAPSRRMSVLISTVRDIPDAAVLLGHPIITVFRCNSNNALSEGGPTSKCRHHVVTQYEGDFEADFSPLVDTSTSPRVEVSRHGYRGVVRHAIDASFHPRYVGRTLERAVVISEDEQSLMLSGALGMLPGNPVGVLKWTRRK